MPDSILNPKQQTVDEQLIKKLAAKDGITPAAAAQKLATMRQHAAELRELMEAAPESSQTLEPATPIGNAADESASVLLTEHQPSAASAAQPAEPGDSETEGTGIDVPRRGRPRG